jgi:hypothetical protein
MPTLYLIYGDKLPLPANYFLCLQMSSPVPVFAAVLDMGCVFMEQVSMCTLPSAAKELMCLG